MPWPYIGHIVAQLREDQPSSANRRNGFHGISDVQPAGGRTATQTKTWSAPKHTVPR